jgi:hypothetical protein
MAKKKETRTDAGAKKEESNTIPVTLPDDSTAHLYSTARLRKKLRRKRRNTTPPAEGV